MYISKNITKS